MHASNVASSSPSPAATSAGIAARLVGAVARTDERAFRECLSEVRRIVPGCSSGTAPLMSFLGANGLLTHHMLIQDYSRSACKHLLRFGLEHLEIASSIGSLPSSAVIKSLLLDMPHLRMKLSSTDLSALYVVLSNYLKTHPVASLIVSCDHADHATIYFECLQAEAQIHFPTTFKGNKLVWYRTAETLVDLLLRSCLTTPEVGKLATALRDGLCLSESNVMHPWLAQLPWQARSCLDGLYSLVSFASKINSMYDETISDAARNDSLRLFLLSHQQIFAALIVSVACPMLNQESQHVISSAVEHTLFPVIRVYEPGLPFVILRSVEDVIVKMASCGTSSDGLHKIHDLIDKSFDSLSHLDSIKSIEQYEPFTIIFEAQALYMTAHCCLALFWWSNSEHRCKHLLTVLVALMERLAVKSVEVTLLGSLFDFVIWEVQAADVGLFESNSADKHLKIQFFRFLAEVSSSINSHGVEGIHRRSDVLKRLLLKLTDSTFQNSEHAAEMDVDPNEVLRAVPHDALRDWLKPTATGAIQFRLR